MRKVKEAAKKFIKDTIVRKAKEHDVTQEVVAGSLHGRYIFPSLIAGMALATHIRSQEDMDKIASQFATIIEDHNKIVNEESSIMNESGV